LRSYTIIEPKELAGDYEESLNTKFNWTEAFVKEFEEKHRFDVHTSVCRSTSGGLGAGPVQFPSNFVEYIPEDQCK